MNDEILMAQVKAINDVYRAAFNEGIEAAEKKRQADIAHWRKDAQTDEEDEILGAMAGIPSYSLLSLKMEEG